MRERARQVIRGLLIATGVYLAMLLMLTLLQRSLIYMPTRQAPIETREAGLPAGRVHDIVVPAADGQSLHGWHFLPANSPAHTDAECDRLLAKASWVVLYFSGNAGHRGYRAAEADLLNRLDCHVFLVDYRGYGDNGGDPSEEAFAKDAESVWRYATVTRQVPPHKILLFGESLGGGVAVRLAADRCDRGERPGGLILRATFPSLVAVAGWHYPWLPVQWAMQERYPSVERIPRVTCPVLHFHGTRDSIVPEKMGRQLFAAAPAQSTNGVEKRYVDLPGVDHNDILETAGGRVREVLRSWLAELDVHSQSPS